MPYKDKGRQTKYQADWVKARRQEFFVGKCCVVCDSTFKLEADHVDPTKKVSHRVWSWAKAKRDAELAKCQVLCRSCHQAKSIEAQRRPLVHGTRTGYSDRGCRCDECKRAKREYTLALKAKKRHSK